MQHIFEYQEYKKLNESLSSARKTFLDTSKIANDDFQALVKIDPSKTKKYLIEEAKTNRPNKKRRGDDGEEILIEDQPLTEENFLNFKMLHSTGIYIYIK